MTPMRAIRKYCIGCQGGSSKAVAYCTVTKCDLWPLRFGRKPKTVRKLMGDKWLDPRQMPGPDESLESLPSPPPLRGRGKQKRASTMLTGK